MSAYDCGAVVHCHLLDQEVQLLRHHKEVGDPPFARRVQARGRVIAWRNDARTQCCNGQCPLTRLRRNMVPEHYIATERHLTNDVGVL